MRPTLLLLILLVQCVPTLQSPIPKIPTPNFVIFHIDDLGYGDLNSYGHPTTHTPNIDDLYFDGGVKFAQATTPDSVCTPNRVALLTGRYPIRTGFADNFYRVLYDSSTSSHIPFNVTTFGDVLKKKGYRTALFGKWHAGLNIDSYNDSMALPNSYGFDYYYGVPYGMNPYNDPNNPGPQASTLYENRELIQQPTYMYEFTNNMNNKILDRINDFSKEGLPFLLHINYLQVHTPMFASEEFQNKTLRGSYGDDLLEVDDSVGKIVTYIKSIGQDTDTVYFLLSDNGPYAEEGVDGGSHGLLKGNKGQTWEGGHRTPLIVRYKRYNDLYSTTKNKVYAGVVSSMDLFPTMIRIVNDVKEITTDHQNKKYRPTLNEPILFDGREIDLKDIYLSTPTTKRNLTYSTHRTLFYYCGQRVLAVRNGSYKTHFYTQSWSKPDVQACGYVDGREYGVCGCTDLDITKHDPPLVYNLDKDPGELHLLTQLNFDQYEEVINRAIDSLNVHVKNVVTVENQMNKLPKPSLEPCCDYPKCCCNHHTCNTM
ncbi:Arylsulfatase-like [Yasminevirus sp. GU-2018]|uniref:Arylsulfatase-like n=1 Tax=Yasminevirus sp. GU-2018 TaxID=2420051 RepID=A0A5K0U9L5_9VIRU|nr:Arylsulfatase-like [Yasminevirus sp. GU-2018]